MASCCREHICVLGDDVDRRQGEAAARPCRLVALRRREVDRRRHLLRCRAPYARATLGFATRRLVTQERLDVALRGQHTFQSKERREHAVRLSRDLVACYMRLALRNFLIRMHHVNAQLVNCPLLCGHLS